MGVTVSGMAAGFAKSLFGGAVSNGTMAGMSASGGGEAKKPKKKLNYNPREISGQLVRANRSSMASTVLVRAKSKLGVLLRAYASGEYDESEVRIAIVHAKRMVECSKLKANNLKEEEILKRRNDMDHNTKEMKKKREIKRRIKRKEKALEAKIAIEENKNILDEKLKRQILFQKRRMNRSEERRRITEADLKYLEDQLSSSQSDDSAGYGGVSLDLSMESAQMAELKMLERQMEYQVQTGVEADMSQAALGIGGEAFASAPAAMASSIVASAVQTVDVAI